MSRRATKQAASLEPQRRLSPWRVLLALFLLIVLAAGGAFGVWRWRAERSQADSKPWFAGYVDVTATPTFAFEQMGATENRNAILSFIVSLPSDPCVPAWGGVYTLPQASGALDLDRRIARLQQQKGNVAISFGGLTNHELAEQCIDPSKLLAAYRSVVNRYNIDTIDLDLEGAGLSDPAAAERRAVAIAQLQSERRSKGKKLAVWLTIPVTPQGLNEMGTDAVTRLLSKGVDLAGVNVMTMEYGNSLPEGQDLLDAAKTALTQTKRQLGILYQRVGIRLNDATLWSKLGATPMIGQNHEVDQILSLKNAKGLNEFARSRGVGRMSMWSVNRDIACGSNYADLKVVSDSCSGVEQQKQEFSQLLGAGFKGSISSSAGLVTTSNATAGSKKPKPDDPDNSPYQIWSPTGAYLQGTKVVWHRNVYQAKWWTQGDEPDSPVLQSWQTPWELIGPVLPGEKPIPQATLPPGTYPEWSGLVAYDTGQRVLFKGVPYQAKWWTQGNSPAAASSNPQNSPWVPLTQAQIDELKTE